MDERLHHVIAGEPDEVVLGAALPFEFTQLRIARDNAVRRPQEVLLDGDNVANVAVVNAFDRFGVSDDSGCATLRPRSHSSLWPDRKPLS